MPNVAVNQGVKRITLDGSVDSLSVNTPNALTIDGTANIDRIIVKSKNTKIKLGTGTNVGKYELPAGTTENDVVENSGGSTGSGGGGGSSSGGKKQFELSLMHFNDTHAHLDNVAKRVTAVNEVRAKKPDALLLDAGDVFSGTLYFNEFLGQADVEFMNLMKVDAMTFGNHEFDLGSSQDGHKALADFIKAANFPFVSANVDFSKDPLFDGLFSTKINKTRKIVIFIQELLKKLTEKKLVFSA